MKLTKTEILDALEGLKNAHTELVILEGPASLATQKAGLALVSAGVELVQEYIKRFKPCERFKGLMTLHYGRCIASIIDIKLFMAKGGE